MKPSTPCHTHSWAFDHPGAIKLFVTVSLLLGTVGCATRSEPPRPEAPQLRASQPGSDRAVLAELKRAIRPLTTVEPGSSYTDLTAFDEAVGNARLVSLGEASHGTREIFQMKHRLFEYLVREKGFTVFAIEANWPESEALDRYIKTGEGDPRAGLKALYVWPWQTEEVLALVEWMREFNQGPGDRPVLTFTGFDMQRYRVALDKTLAAVKDTPEAPAVEAAYSALRVLDDPWFSPAGTTKPAGFRLSNPDLKGIADDAEAVVRLLEERKATAKTVQMARIVAQALRCRVGEIRGCRDQMMARNVLWLLDEAHPDEKMVVWAHNGHVTHQAEVPWSGRPMGNWLREALGSQMYVLGFAIDGGTVRAKRLEEGKWVDPIEHILPQAAPGTGTAMLSQAGTPMFFLNMKTARSALGAWLDDEHLFRVVGGGIDDNQATMSPDRIGRSYDGLIFLRETSASRPL